MKSKAHHKKCTELGIIPVPTTVDDANIDEDSLARQESLRNKLAGGGSGGGGGGGGAVADGESDPEDDDDDDEEDDAEDAEDEEEEESEFTEAAAAAAAAATLSGGQFEDATCAAAAKNSAASARAEAEQEVARSLLDLGVIGPAGSKPTTYPYAKYDSHANSAADPIPMPAPRCDPQPDPPALDASKPPAGAQDLRQTALRKAQQPMDLSTGRTCSAAGRDPAHALPPLVPLVVVAETASQSNASAPPSFLASIYRTPHRVAHDAAPTVAAGVGGVLVRSLAPADSGSEPRTGMLQAYLTEKALKDSIIKRQQVAADSAATSQQGPPPGKGENVSAFLCADAAAVKSVKTTPGVAVNPPPTNRSTADNKNSTRQSAATTSAGRDHYYCPSSAIRTASTTAAAAAAVAVAASVAADRANVMRAEMMPCSRTVVSASGIPEFLVPLCSANSTPSTATVVAAAAAATPSFKMTDDGKTACSICNKVFTKPSQLRLHINIHYFERPFRCDACAVSFRTKGHLQKHKRSVTHFNKVAAERTFLFHIHYLVVLIIFKTVLKHF